MLRAGSNLAWTYCIQGQWDEAEEFDLPLLDPRKRLLGATHPDTLQSMQHLASIYMSQDRFEQAEKL